MLIITSVTTIKLLHTFIFNFICIVHFISRVVKISRCVNLNYIVIFTPIKLLAVICGITLTLISITILPNADINCWLKISPGKILYIRKYSSQIWFAWYYICILYYGSKCLHTYILKCIMKGLVSFDSRVCDLIRLGLNMIFIPYWTSDMIM